MIRFFGFALACLLLIPSSTTLAADSPAQTLRDDFSNYAAGSDGAPAWDPQSAGWEVRDGGCVGNNGVNLWHDAPFASEVSFACDVTVLEQLKGGWLVAGIGLQTDENNYWAAGLVAAPEAMQRRHSAELQESVNGHWLAQTSEGSRLKPLPGKGGFDWQLNQTYHFEMTLTADAVTARISQGAAERARFGWRLTGTTPAVRAGRPVLRANGLRARFSNATVTVRQTTPEPKVEVKKSAPWTSRKGKPIAKGTGFFRAAFIADGREVGDASRSTPDAPRSPNGRWWLVDPEGKPFFDVGTDHVNYRGHWCEALGYSPYHRNVAAKFGSEEKWAASALERLTTWGFNTLPAGHALSLRHHGLPHILFASFGSSFAHHEWIAEPIHWTGFPDVFSPRWPSYCRFIARKMAQESRGDPWCLGTFLDNELEWYGKKGHLVDEVFKLAPTAPAKHALLDWLLKRWGNFAEVNRRLGTNYADEQAFLAATTVPRGSAGILLATAATASGKNAGKDAGATATDALTEVRDGFLAEIAERYFSVPAKALREADPDHLVLGCRFAGRAPEPALPAAGKYNDVFTFNTYPRVDFENTCRPDGTGGVVQRVPRELAEMYRVVRRPMIITEWSFPALDSGLPCKHGAGMRVDTQKQKAACYRIFANAMADLPFMVGYHYFMWADEPAPGISRVPEDSNYGVVNEKDETYETLVKTATEVNRAAAARHALSIFSGDMELRAAKNAVELSNTNAVPAHGTLRLNAAGKCRIEEVVLKPKSTRRVAVPAKDAWCAELQQWDGTKSRLVGGKTLGPLDVANASAATLDGVPVVLDGPPVVAAMVSQLEPGRTLTLTAPTSTPAETERLELKADGATWLCERKDGSLFDAIRAGDLPMGRLIFAAHQKINGRDFWTEANRITSLRVQEQADAWIVEAVVEYTSSTATGAGHFRAGLRAAVFKCGGLALVKPLWIENNDKRPWLLAGPFWFCRPAIGGSTDNNIIGGANVPNYYRASQFITDSKLGGCFGAIGQPDGWRVLFWKDTSIHPDVFWKMERELRVGERHEFAGMPYVWIYALRDANGWRDIARRSQQATQGLLTAESAKAKPAAE